MTNENQTTSEEATVSVHVNIDAAQPGTSDQSTVDLNTQMSDNQTSQEQAAGQSQAEHTPQNKQGKKPKNKKPVDLSPLKNYHAMRQQAFQSSSLHKPNKTNAVLTKLMGDKKRINPDSDGVDHINTSAIGKTRLGKLLDMNAFSKFKHAQLGEFASLGGFRFFLAGDQDDAFRTLSDTRVRVVGARKTLKRVENFRTIMAEATWDKITQNNELINLMIESTLPFRSYYLQGELQLPSFSNDDAWYMPILEECRKALIKNAQVVKNAEQAGTDVNIDELIYPDFSFLEETNIREKRKPRRN
jgi:hypothetical protein